MIYKVYIMILHCDREPLDKLAISNVCFLACAIISLCEKRNSKLDLKNVYFSTSSLGSYYSYCIICNEFQNIVSPK